MAGVTNEQLFLNEIKMNARHEMKIHSIKRSEYSPAYGGASYSVVISGVSGWHDLMIDVPIVFRWCKPVMLGMNAAYAVDHSATLQKCFCLPCQDYHRRDFSRSIARVVGFVAGRDPMTNNYYLINKGAL